MLTRSSLQQLLFTFVATIATVQAFVPQFQQQRPNSAVITTRTQYMTQIEQGSHRWGPLFATDDDAETAGSTIAAAIEQVLQQDDDEEEEDTNDYIVTAGELENDDDSTDVGIEDDGLLPGWAITAQRIAEVRVQYRRHDSDTGSPEYQVAGMTERINYLTKHLQLHPKDFSTRRGLVALVNKRRRLLNYLAREDVPRYKELIASLGIRHKAPGLVPSREEPYQRFPRQKAIKKHLVNKN